MTSLFGKELTNEFDCPLLVMVDKLKTILSSRITHVINIAHECTETSQKKCIEYIHCFYDVNEIVYIIITIVNIPLILYHVFFS